MLALLWVAGAAGQLAAGEHVLGLLWAVSALGWAAQWWIDPGPRLTSVTDEALLVRRGVRTRAIPRADLRSVRALYTVGYGLELTLVDDELVQLANTALKYSVADAQAAALRRWAGLPPVS